MCASFSLPPELAYLVVSVSDSLHLGLPNELIGAGRTMSELRKVDPDFQWVIPTVSMKYINDPRFGWNVAGMSIFPLLILGLLAFTLTARVRPQPECRPFTSGVFSCGSSSASWRSPSTA